MQSSKGGVKGLSIKYIGGRPQNGILYDWKKIKKEYKKLKCPKDVYDPLKCDWSLSKYNVALSDRSRGKTTNPLLVAMIMYRDYMTTPHYLRNTKDQCRPMMMQDLFETIREYQYVSRIFGEEWNDLDYYAKRWCLVYRDESGKILRSADRPVLVCFGIDEHQDLKSVYNAPRGDIILFDEFIETTYRYNSFFNFKNMLKTIVRDRQSAVCYMMANTTNKETPWFDDMMIRDYITGIEQGQARYIEAGDGVRYYIDILPPDQSERRKLVNELYFGHGNPKLASITGQAMWSTEDYPHIPPYKEDEPEIIYNRLYMQHAGRLLQLQLVRRELGLAVHVVPARRTYDDSWILTSGFITDPRQLFGAGPKDTILDTYWRLYKANRWFYATNSEGSVVSSYIKYLKTLQRERMI